MKTVKVSDGVVYTYDDEDIALFEDICDLPDLNRTIISDQIKSLLSETGQEPSVPA